MHIEKVLIITTLMDNISYQRLKLEHYASLKLKYYYNFI